MFAKNGFKLVMNKRRFVRNPKVIKYHNKIYSENHVRR